MWNTAWPAARSLFCMMLMPSALRLFFRAVAIFCVVCATSARMGAGMSYIFSACVFGMTKACPWLLGFVLRNENVVSSS